MAGALFGQNRNDADEVFSALNPAGEYLSITAGDFFAARRAALTRPDEPTKET